MADSVELRERLTEFESERDGQARLTASRVLVADALRAENQMLRKKVSELESRREGRELLNVP